MGEKQRSLFRKLNHLSAALVVLVGLWIVWDAMILLTVATLAGAATGALLLGRELRSD